VRAGGIILKCIPVNEISLVSFPVAAFRITGGELSGSGMEEFVN
jgi:hypothetical protein